MGNERIGKHARMMQTRDLPVNTLLMTVYDRLHECMRGDRSFPVPPKGRRLQPVHFAWSLDGERESQVRIAGGRLKNRAKPANNGLTR